HLHAAADLCGAVRVGAPLIRVNLSRGSAAASPSSLVGEGRGGGREVPQLPPGKDPPAIAHEATPDPSNAREWVPISKADLDPKPTQKRQPMRSGTRCRRISSHHCIGPSVQTNTYLISTLCW